MGYVLRRVALKLYNYYAKVFAVNYLSTTLEGAYLCYVLTGGFLPMDVVFFSFSILFCDHQKLNYILKIYSFLTHELSYVLAIMFTSTPFKQDFRDQFYSSLQFVDIG